MPEVRPLAEPDLPEAQRIVRRAFGTFFGVPNLDEFWTDFDFVYGRFGCEHTASFAADCDGALAGSNFATRWGSVDRRRRLAQYRSAQVVRDGSRRHA